MDASNQHISPLNCGYPTSDSQRNCIPQLPVENPSTQAETVACQSGFEIASQETYVMKGNDLRSSSSKRIAKKAPQLESMTTQSTINNDCYADASEDNECSELGIALEGLSHSGHGIVNYASLMNASLFDQGQVSQQYSPKALTFEHMLHERRGGFFSEKNPPHNLMSPCPSPSETTASSFHGHHHYGGAGNGVQSSPPLTNLAGNGVQSSPSPPNAHPRMLNSPPPPVSTGVPSVVSPLTFPSSNDRSNNPNEPPQPDASTCSDSLPGTPVKARGNAKDDLHKRYDLVNRQIPKKNFVTWNDDGKDHEPYWTGIFVCTQTGECFSSGELNSLVDDDSGTLHQHHGRTHWYGTKKKAIEAAAGRAEDCFRFREEESTRSGVRYQFCVEAPYGVAAAVMAPPASIPQEKLQMIERLQNQAYSRQ